MKKTQFSMFFHFSFNFIQMILLRNRGKNKKNWIKKKRVEGKNVGYRENRNAKCLTCWHFWRFRWVFQNKSLILSSCHPFDVFLKAFWNCRSCSQKTWNVQRFSFRFRHFQHFRIFSFDKNFVFFGFVLFIMGIFGGLYNCVIY